MSMKNVSPRADIAKFTRWKGQQLMVRFINPLADLSKEVAYSKYQPKRPTVEDRKNYLDEVLSFCGMSSTIGLEKVKQW